MEIAQCLENVFFEPLPFSLRCIDVLALGAERANRFHLVYLFSNLFLFEIQKLADEIHRKGEIVAFVEEGFAQAREIVRVERFQSLLKPRLSSFMFLGPGVDHDPAPERALPGPVSDDEMVSAQRQHGICEGYLAIARFFGLNLFFRTEEDQLAQPLCRSQVDSYPLVIFYPFRCRRPHL